MRVFFEHHLFSVPFYKTTIVFFFINKIITTDFKLYGYARTVDFYHYQGWKTLFF